MTSLLTAALLLAGPPRFLGPPEKKPADSDSPGLQPGAVAPSLSAPVANPNRAAMRRVEVPNARARVILLSFFDSACAACKAELPVLDDLYTQHKAGGLLVVAVAPEPAVLLSLRAVSYPVIEDRDSAVARSYLGPHPAYPAVVIVGRDGRIASAKAGYRDDPAVLLRAEVESALR